MGKSFTNLSFFWGIWGLLFYGALTSKYNLRVNNQSTISAVVVRHGVPGLLRNRECNAGLKGSIYGTEYGDNRVRWIDIQVVIQQITGSILVT